MQGLPPEVVSGLIYTGPGNSSLMSAAQEWAGLAEGLETDALQLRAVMAALGDVWQGHTSQAALGAVQQYLTWLESTATAASRSASAALGAASAFEQVLAAVVPVPVIASNRAQLLMLVATNLLGQNTSAISALEAQYEGMWAQDEVAMTTYQADSTSSVGQLPTFSPAPQVAAAATPAADPITTLLGGPGSFLYDSFQALLSSGAPIDIVALFSSFFGPFLGAGMVAGQVAAQNAIIASKPTVPSVVYPPAAATPKAAEIKASAGQGNRIGPMRVPPSWAQPRVASPATSLPPGGGKDRDHPVGLPVIPFVPLAGGKTAKKRKGYSDPDDMHYGAPTPPVLPRHPSGG